MRLLFFNRSFHPDVEATGQLLAELCQDLRAHHDVTVVAGRSYNMERFGSWWPVKREQWEGVTILRAYNPRLDKRVFAGRVVNLLSYFGFSAVAGCFARRPDVVVVETDPPVLGLVALLFARIYRAKFVFYLQDLYPDVGVALGKLRNPILIKILEASTQRILRSADRVIVLGEDMRQRVAAKGYPHPERIRVVPNWVDTQRVQPQPDSTAFRQAHGLVGKFVVMFSGNLGLSQGLERIVEVAGQLVGEAEIQFVFVGEGAAKVGLEAQARGLRNVQFLPYQPKESLAISLGAADVHLVPLQRGLAGLIVPSKVYGIMAAGRAFIAPIEAGSEVATIVEQFRCGVRVEPGDVAGLREAIRWAARHRAELVAMGQCGRAAAVEHFDRKISVAKFHATVQDLAVGRVDVSSSEFRVPVNSRGVGGQACEGKQEGRGEC